MLFDQLAHGQALGRGFVLGQHGHVLGRLRQLLAQHISNSQLPRKIGLVREAPEFLASVVLRPRMPPRPYWRTPSTRRHSGPVTPGMP